MRVGIVGGGLEALAGAYDLLKRGHKVTLFEEGPSLGGSVATCKVGTSYLERLPQVVLREDSALLGLIRELGLESTLQWVRPKLGVFHDGKVVNLGHWGDLLRFSPLKPKDRVLLGLLFLSLLGTRDWKRLEGMRAVDWTIKRGSRQTYQRVWGPLLRHLFGDAYSQVSAVWLWSKLRHSLEFRGPWATPQWWGYPQGGFQGVLSTLEQRIRSQGGSILVKTSVEDISVADGRVLGVGASQRVIGGQKVFYPCDAVMVTVHSRALLRLVPGLQGMFAEQVRSIAYQPMLCMALALRRPLSPHHWIQSLESGTPWSSILALPELSSAEGNREYRTYLCSYPSHDHPLRWLSRDEMLSIYKPFLKQLNPEFDDSWIVGYALHRKDSAYPVPSLGFSRCIPRVRTPVQGLWLADSAQIYPGNASTNAKVQQVLRVGRMATG